MAIAFVQFEQDFDSTGSSAATAAMNTTTGNFIVVTTGFYDAISADTVESIADTAGNTYVKAMGEYRASSGQDRIEIWYAENITGNANNITTITYTGSVSDPFISTAEFSGVATSSSLDDTANNSQTSTTNHTSGNMTASSAGSLTIGGIATSSTATFTVGSGYTTLSDDLTIRYYCAEYKIQGASGTYAATFSTSGNENSIMGGAIFKVAGAPPPSGTNQWINKDDTLRQVTEVWLNKDDTWRKVDEAWVNKDDTWRKMF